MPAGGLVQFAPRPGILDLGWGHPHPDALPVEAWHAAGTAALRRYGPDALAYGHPAGPAPLVEWLCARLGEVDAVAPEPGQVFVTGGASHALELLCAHLVRPGDTVLVESPTYHLALRIIADHAADLVPLPAGGEFGGVDPDRTAALIARLRAAGRRIPLLYLVPTHNNPTGASLPASRRAALVDVARRTGVPVVEDDTYRELSYDGPPPPSLFALAGADRAAGGGGDGGADRAVLRIGSFAKTVGPGLRLGWITGTAALVRELCERGYVHSGGGVNHTTALAMAQFGASGRYATHLATVRDRYRRQRDALVAALRSELPTARFAVPAGGWFVWLRLPGVDTARLLPAAEAAGVSYVPGTRFHVEGGGCGHARLAFSMLDGERLGEAVRRLATALRARPDAAPAETEM